MSAQGQTFPRMFGIKNMALLMLVALCGSSVVAAEKPTSTAAVTQVKLWNGNKTQSRQQYEREVLEAALKVTTATHGKYQLQEDLTD